MIELVFFAAVSSDGFLAGPDGDMSWAEKYLNTDEDYGFVELLSSTSAVLMGSKTFDFEQEAMGGEPRALPTYVLTNSPMRYDGLRDPLLHFVSGPIEGVLEELERHVSGQLLVMGGADVVRQCIDAGRLNSIRLFVTPDILGSGLALFQQELEGALEAYDLVRTRTFSTGLEERNYQLSDS
jgi:dihydrofolate reductase